MAQPRDISRIVPDAAALRALTHPHRTRILGILRLEGPQTATGLARRLGLNTGATSYHLRQLARHGFTEEAQDLGSRRDRWWRARHESTALDDDAPEGSAEAQAAGAFLQSVLTGHAAQLQRAVAAHPDLPPDWRRASTASDATLWLTAEEAKALSRRLVDLLLEAKAATPPLDRPPPSPDARRFTVMIHAFPYPGFDGDPE